MDRSRRGFLTASAAITAGQLAGLSSQTRGAEPVPRDDRKAITREEMLALDAKLGRGNLTCVRTPEANEGPFYYGSSQRRRNLTEGRRGMPLKLGITIANALVPGNTCSPLAGAIVDVWQADADGMYSNVGDDLQNVATIGQTFMRGHQVTSDSGRVEFDTVVPGWELVVSLNPRGAVIRTTHIHVKVFHENKIATAQLYFPDEFLDGLYATVDPYRQHRTMTAPGLTREFDRIRNGDDIVFIGDQSKPMPVQRSGDGATCEATIGLVTMGAMGLAPRFR